MVAVTHSRPAALALSFVLATASSASAEDPPLSGHLEVAGYVEGLFLSPVTRARLAAVEKLRSAKCRELFSEFQDLAGRSLDDVLLSHRETSEQRLWRMVFRDGSSAPGCHQKNIFAFTSPGSLTVFVCSNFRELAELETGAAANILIHEELHSLGAGEAPMPGLLTTRQITARVTDRCGWR
ncbi:MAG TPA: hypothetical protein VF376_03995 [Thermoanaerobaculia bacterium]